MIKNETQVRTYQPLFSTYGIREKSVPIECDYGIHYLHLRGSHPLILSNGLG